MEVTLYMDVYKGQLNNFYANDTPLINTSEGATRYVITFEIPDLIPIVKIDNAQVETIKIEKKKNDDK